MDDGTRPREIDDGERDPELRGGRQQGQSEDLGGENGIINLLRRKRWRLREEGLRVRASLR